MNGPGIVTVSAYLMTPDGARHMHFFCKDWKVITDAHMPIENFHSRERWSLIGTVKDKTAIVIPGCQVSGFLSAEKCPIKSEKFYADKTSNRTGAAVGVFDLETMTTKGRGPVSA